MASLNQAVPADLSKTIKVIGAGHPRTGTSSLVLALEILLKHPVMHSGSACVSREEAFMKSWLSLLSSRTPYEDLSKVEQESIRSELRKVCAGYVGIADMPGAQFVAELADTFPDAVIVCTVRDPQRWWKSFGPVADTIATMRALNILFQPLPTLRFFGRWFDLMSARAKETCRMPDGSKSEGAKGPEWLAMHQEYVERAVKSVRGGKSARVHYFDVKDGWEPLCKILNLPVPDEPFPHANDAEAVQEIMQDFIKAALMRWAVIFAVLAVVGYGAWVALV